MIIGVINNEYAPASYAIRTYLADIEEYFNASTNRTELRGELSRSPLDRLSLSIGHGREWNTGYTFRIDRPGIFRVAFLPSKLPDEQAAYRTLWPTVRGPAAQGAISAASSSEFTFPASGVVAELPSALS